MAERKNNTDEIKNLVLGDPLHPYLMATSKLLFAEFPRIGAESGEDNSRRVNQLGAITSVLSMQIAERQRLPDYKPFNHPLRPRWELAIEHLDETVSKGGPESIMQAVSAFAVCYGELAIQIDRQTSSLWEGREVKRDLSKLPTTPQAIAFAMAFVVATED